MRSWEVETAGMGPVRLTAVPRAEWARLTLLHPGDPWGAGFLPALLRASLPGVSVADSFAAIDDTDDGPLLQDALLGLSQPVITDRIRAALHDPRTRAELGYCGKVGITRTEFHALPDDEQDLAVAWWLTEVNVCPGCGAPAEDMLLPSAPWAVRERACFHCDVLHHARENVPEERRHAVHVDLIRTGGGGS